ncbi:energy transducer TonB [Noviherbaspirillum sp.]|uniref:energy transducer TonB n=1 Tax=Noviherbaspirillum sp. TaxID=1926288 RepID=UPI002FE3176B
MNTAFLPAGSAYSQPRLSLNRVGPLGAIILAHAGLLYILQAPSKPQPSPSAPREIMATFITPAPAPAPALPPEPVPKPVAEQPRPVPPEPVKPQPAPKKVKRIPKKTETPTRVPAAVEEPVPSTQTAAAPPEPAPPAAAAPSAPMPAAPAPTPVPAQPRTVTSGIQYLQAPQPEYPPLAKRMGEEGKAILRVLVNDKGRPEKIELQKSTGSALLDEAARQAVARALFKPFMEDGKPVAAYAIVPINFQIAS